MKKFAVLSMALLILGCSAHDGSAIDTASSSSGDLISTNAYDAVSLFGLGASSMKSLPAPEPGELVINYGGWSLNQLMATKDGKRLVKYFDDSYSNEAWANDTLPAGIYHLSEAVQKESPIPVVLLATAILAYDLQIEKGRVSSKQDPLPLMTDNTHCNDPKKPDALIGLYWSDDWGTDGKSHSTTLYIEKEYCNVLGGGVWEASM